MQDKQIREKLNSLDTLPEDYTPSLDSKWELLQAGQPVKKQKQPYFWYAAAASLLLLLGFGFLFLNRKTTGEAPVLARQKTSAPKPYSPISGNASSEIAASNMPPSEAKSERPEKAFAQNGRVSAPKVRTSEAEIAEAAETGQTGKPELVIEIPETQTVHLAAAKPEKTKKKHKFVEVDFDAPAAPISQPQPVQTAQIQFKVKLLPKPSEAAPAVVQQENPLRLQHTF